MLEAFNIDLDSGITPKSGTDKISHMSVTFNISPVFTLSGAYLVTSKCSFTGLSLSSERFVLLDSMPSILSESRTDEISGFVTITAWSA